MLKLSGLSGLAFGIVLSIYSLLVPLGPTKITLPFPIPDTVAMTIIYWMFFFAAYGVLLPLAETAYFAVFLEGEMSQHFAALRDFVISAAYAGVNFILILFVVQEFVAVLVYTGFAFGIMFALLYIKKTQGLSYAAVFRFSLGIGICVWLLYLKGSEKNWFGRKSPEFFASANLGNFWHKV